MEKTEMRYVGIDLAKRSFEARFEYPDERKGKRFSGKTSATGIGKLIEQLTASDRVGMECCAYAFFLAKMLIDKVGCEVYVLNAGKLAIIYKSTKKTDLEDAAKIAWLLRRFPPEELPVVPLPTEKELHRRQMVSEISSRKRHRNALINRLHTLYVRVGITGIEKKDLKTEGARKTNVALLDKYASREAERIDALLEVLEKQIKDIGAEIMDELKDEPLMPHLMSIPGVGPATGMAFLAHVGDGSRFTSGRQVSNFVGMTPRVDNSGETVKMGNITKRGCKAIRSLIVQAAWAAVHSKTSNSFKTKYLELYQRRGKGRAIVAVARRMLVVMWTVMVRKEFYNQMSEKALEYKLRYLGLKKKKVEPAA